MKVKIIRVADSLAVDAAIALPSGTVLPSLADGWRFNFKSNTRKENLQTYVLVCDDTPKTIEGCLSFKMKDKSEPYMAYVETAPHNQGAGRRYDHVAGCLIAFACRLSFMYGKEDNKGWLAFDVLEEHKADEEKLMKLYSKKYKAVRYAATTTMLIPPEGGEKLIDEYLNR